MALYTKCLKCGKWKGVAENPSAEDQIPTGMMMYRNEPPKDLCACDADAGGDAT